MRARVMAVVLAAGLVWLASACAVPMADLGGPTSAAYGINDAGVVVGVSETAASTAGHRVDHAFRLGADGVAVDLPPLAGQDHSRAYKINESGTAVGVSSNGGMNQLPRAVRWDASGQVSDFGFGYDSLAWDINDAGVIVGQSGNGWSSRQAFVFDPAVGHPVFLALLPGSSTSFARDINDAGQVVGNVDEGSSQVPVRWDLANGTVTDLSASTGLSAALAINDAGAIAGVARTAPGGTTYAALWLPGAVTPIDLGAGPGIPMALSDGGTVVGHAPTGSGDRAFRWDAITGLQWLTAGPASQAWDVNTAGTIVGSASQQASYLAGDPA